MVVLDFHVDNMNGTIELTASSQQVCDIENESPISH
jgi:hypothetical protein